MKVALACGGTGGHIFPGLATADVLKARGHDVTLWLAGRDVESAAVSGWTGPIRTVSAAGFASSSPIRAALTIWRLFKAVHTCKAIMEEDQPDVVLAMGSYASVGPVGAALRLRIPFVLHESNVLPGRANSLMSRWARYVAGCFEETRYYLRRRDLILTGMPLRKELEARARERQRAPSPTPFTVLVLGGSQGAPRLNEITSAAIKHVHREKHAIKVLHLTGAKDEAFIQDVYANAGVPAEVSAFSKDIASLYARAHLAICRSGAATCAELSAFGVPALLVPFPYATHDHQMANARAMEHVGAADVVPEHDLSAAWLARYIIECIRMPERLQKMSAATRARARHSGAELLADLVEKAGSENGVRPR